MNSPYMNNELSGLWIEVSLRRFQTEVGKKLSRQVAQTGSDDWWFTEKSGSWWVDRTPPDSV